MLFINVFDKSPENFTEITDGVDGFKRVIKDNVKAFSKPVSNQIQTQISVIGVQSNYLIISQGENVDELVKLLREEKVRHSRAAFAADKVKRA